jgi:transposase InsO family protein
MALESRGMVSKEACSGLVLRSDNGAQPSSKHFVEFLGKRGIKGQYTGYSAPDDNAYVERIIRTIKEEEIWCSDYESLSEARECIDDYVCYYNRDRLHSSLDYQTPDEVYEASRSSQLAA